MAKIEIRDPMEKAKQKYQKEIEEKTFTPRFFWQQCVCCGKEYRKIPMYRVRKGYLSFDASSEYNGCSQCFHSSDEFRKWLEENGYLLSEHDFWYLNEVRERLRNNDPTLTKKQLRKYLELHLE